MRQVRLEALDLNLLLALHWLLESGSVTAAAEKVGLSQPALSRALGRLRETFGDPLLVQTGRRMVPTPFAEGLRAPLGDAIERLRLAVRPRDAFDPATARGAFRVVCTDYVGLVIAKLWARRIGRAAPGLDLEIMALDAQTIAGLVSGAVDLAIMPDVGIGNLPRSANAEQFVQRPLFEEDFVTIARKGHPAAGRRLSVSAFAGLEHVLASPSGQGLGVVDRLLKARGAERRIAYRVQSFLTALQIVSFTECVATLPRRLVEASDQKFATVTPPFKVPGFAMLSGWHPTRTSDAAHRWVREKIAAEV